MIHQPAPIAPLVTFRIVFGALMCYGAVRFMAEGWIEVLFVQPTFFFKFYGFEWVAPLGVSGMYIVYVLIALSALLVMVGLWYHWAMGLFLIAFTYTELIDATNYLNHYYLVGLLGFILLFLPANRAFSFDAWRKPPIQQMQVKAWQIHLLIFQVGLVYCCAGIAKLNPDWLWRAMPLSIWLPEHTHLPVIGYFFQFKATAFLFSWIGAAYDLSIPFLLLYRRTRPFAYFLVLVFHAITWLLFNIGLFPLIMIGSTLIFFPAGNHQRWLGYLGYKPAGVDHPSQSRPVTRWFIGPALLLFVIVQLVLPFRHCLYPGNVLWTEEGYRFSWRVMLVEKNGLATFRVQDQGSDRVTEIINSRYLTTFQEKQMSIQPDFILQFAQLLKKDFEDKHGFTDPVITADVFVALNGRTSQRLFPNDINLAAQRDHFGVKKWLLDHKF